LDIDIERYRHLIDYCQKNLNEDISKRIEFLNKI
jgi:hypothetical protein